MAEARSDADYAIPPVTPDPNGAAAAGDRALADKVSEGLRQNLSMLGDLKRIVGEAAPKVVAGMTDDQIAATLADPRFNSLLGEADRKLVLDEAARRGIHVAAFDGRGGASRMDWTPEEGRTEENFGTRDPNYRGRWSVIESGPDGRRYVNDKTGEETFVKNGETAPWDREKTPVEAARVRAQAALDLEKMKQAGKVDLAKLTNEQRKELQQAELTLKKYGIDAGVQSERAKGATERKRIVADMMKKLPEVMSGMGLKDAQADEFRAKLMQAFERDDEPAAQPSEPSPSESGDETAQTDEYNPKASYEVGDIVTRGGERYRLGNDKRFHLVK